jgi:hypothetical protein
MAYISGSQDFFLFLKLLRTPSKNSYLYELIHLYIFTVLWIKTDNFKEYSFKIAIIKLLGIDMHYLFYEKYFLQQE